MKWELLLPGCTTNSTPRPASRCPLLPRTAAALFHQAGKGVTKSTCNLATFHCIAGCRLPLAACWRIFCNVTLETPPFRLPTPPPAVPCVFPAFRSTACHSHFGLDFARIFQLHYFSQQWNRKEVENLQRRCPPAQCEAVRLDVWQSGCVAFSHVATSLNLITNPRRGSL